MEKSNTRRQQQRSGAEQLTRGRKFSAEELRLTLLWCLQQAPAHGYQLIKQLGALSHGYYSPSPGVLYPALAQLEASRLAEVEQCGKRKRYRLTAAGRDYVQAHQQQAELLIAALRHAAKRMQWLSLAGESEALASETTGWLPEYIHARRALRTALLANSEADHAAQRRLIEILQRASAEILAVAGRAGPSSEV
ncbi:PadR family transcriptional regulator [Alcanivorax quisquiliarum]|uniref:PadR family transcriptional regulator n=1 Tax=Alcanivorax quisquiliarum TaxID=2933565 RepID=A0ABT0E7F1_9GAMM|nr:PadR family transcriptional regulator [Alcanivorax quisquiliarum]MCK0537756.1 PadR family transcriptional regulator [Alcanivorax quisquiliarum]